MSSPEPVPPTLRSGMRKEFNEAPFRTMGAICMIIASLSGAALWISASTERLNHTVDSVFLVVLPLCTVLWLLYCRFRAGSYIRLLYSIALVVLALLNVSSAALVRVEARQTALSYAIVNGVVSGLGGKEVLIHNPTTSTWVTGIAMLLAWITLLVGISLLSWDYIRVINLLRRVEAEVESSVPRLPS